MNKAGMVVTGAAMAALLAGGVAEAATKSKSSSKPAAQPAAAAPAPAPAATPAVKRGPQAPEAVKLRNPTPAEIQANAVWNIRAALNIAALQCQFLPFLATVRTYNDILRHHSEELNQARLTMLDHFKRLDGAKYQASFDQYTTRTYNSFSTIDAQLPFCEEAGWVGRQVLATPKGGFGKVALQLNPELRASLEPGFGLPKWVTRIDTTPQAVPDFSA